MPLVMYPGKTGERLIARLPVVEGSYALITTDFLADLKVFHPEGLEINGYPAISPDLSSLPKDLSVPIEAHRQALHNQADRRELELDREMRRAWRLREPDDAPLSAVLAAAFAQITDDIERTRLNRTRQAIDKLPICTCIMEGRRLCLKLPKGVFGDLSTIELGTVTDITRHNVEAPPGAES